MVWWGVGKGGVGISEEGFFKLGGSECILVVWRVCGNERGGRMVGRGLGMIELGVGGGGMRSRLCGGGGGSCGRWVG